MAKTKTVFFCTNCGNETPKWMGRCPGCGAFNTMEEHSGLCPNTVQKRIFFNRGGFEPKSAMRNSFKIKGFRVYSPIFRQNLKL